MAQELLDRALGYIEKHIRNGNDRWSGRSHDLGDVNAHGQGAVALLHIVMHRWLALFE